MKDKNYKYGFDTDLNQDILPKGLNTETIKKISAKKNEPEWLLNFRLKAFEHWKKQKEPTWGKIKYKPIDYQNISYFAELSTSQKSLKQLKQDWISILEGKNNEFNSDNK